MIFVNTKKEAENIKIFLEKLNLKAITLTRDIEQK